MQMPADEISLYVHQAQNHCLAAGLNAYEISNHAKAGQESRHNLAATGGDWIGDRAVGRIWQGHGRQNLLLLS